MTTKKIDLLALAKHVAETFEEIELDVGTVRLYQVPDALAWGERLDRSPPETPIVTMKTVTGSVQRRAAKEGDKGYSEYLKALRDYERDEDELRSAARVVYALRDIEYPDISSPPEGASHIYKNGSWPSHPILRKKIWLDYTLLARGGDTDKVYRAIARMVGRDIDDSAVDDIKKNSE